MKDGLAGEDWVIPKGSGTFESDAGTEGRQPAGRTCLRLVNESKREPMKAARYAVTLKALDAEKSEAKMKHIVKIEWELWLSVHTLAVSHENIKNRLARAYLYHLQYVHCDQMPTENMQNKLNKIQSKLSAFKPDATGHVSQKFRNKTCHDLADGISYLYYEYANFEWHLIPAE